MLRYQPEENIGFENYENNLEDDENEKEETLNYVHKVVFMDKQVAQYVDKTSNCTNDNNKEDFWFIYDEFIV